MLKYNEDLERVSIGSSINPSLNFDKLSGFYLPGVPSVKLPVDDERKLLEYFKKVISIVEEVDKEIVQIEANYAGEPFVDRAIRDIKAEAYDKLEDLLVNYA